MRLQLWFINVRLSMDSAPQGKSLRPIFGTQPHCMPTKRSRLLATRVSSTLSVLSVDR